MESAIVKIVLSVLAALGLIFGAVRYGKGSEAKKELKDKNDVLKEYTEIDSSPDPDDPAAGL